MNDKEVAEVIRGGSLSLDEDGTLSLFEGKNGTIGPSIREVEKFDFLRSEAMLVHEAAIRETWAKLIEERAARIRERDLADARRALLEAGELP
jgi:hypothetical protein